ncbi:unnamed protein product [Nippostrongylus brasiliensis]|uniref:AMP-binding domain-containing protein n=1 Tax=Nippostrongylus brasiliensis TaxID=27835 RepID=A0A0N4XYZ7_NIPBR|nr:unnamed protein product [Nippostrongylus brasiliensis]
MQTIPSHYPSLKKFDLSQYDVTMSVDETPSSTIDTEGSIEHDDLISTATTDEHESIEAIEPKLVLQVPAEPSLSPTPRQSKKKLECESWNRWLFAEINKVTEKTPEHVALVDEVGERRYITYQELLNNVNRAANFLRHHGIDKGARVAVCMSNSLEYIYFELALFLIDAVPILLNPGHVASERFPKLQCTAVLVDGEHYGNVLRSLANFSGIGHIFVLTTDVGSLYIPRFIWIIDAYGYLNFHSNPPWTTDAKYEVDEVVAFSTSGTTSQKSKVVGHGSESAHRLCTEFIDVLVEQLVERVSESRTHHLVTSGLHTIDTWSLLMHSLVSDRTLIITESNSDVWAVSSLDRIAELIQLYDIALITTNPQFLKSFLKYEIHNLYDISSLKVVSYSGSPLPISVARKFQQMTNSSILQVYCSTELGPISYGVLDNTGADLLIGGRMFDGVTVKVADTDDEELDVPCGVWGQILIRSPIIYTRYLGEKSDSSWTAQKWLRTGEKLGRKLLIPWLGEAQYCLLVVSVLLENALAGHPSIEDVVVANLNDELAAGIVVAVSMQLPTVDELNEFLQEQKFARITRIVQVDFIPRSETGKLLRSEVPFLLQSEDDNRLLECAVNK